MPDGAKPKQRNLDFNGARLHSVDFQNATITDGYFQNTEISGDIEGLRINGVDVEPLVTEELDRRFPVRVKIRAEDPSGLAEAWAIVERSWSETTVRARRSLPESAFKQQVDEEWSFVETLRHLIFATDCWLLRAIKGIVHPYHPWGLPGDFLADPAALGIDVSADPSLDEVLSVRRNRMDAVRQTIVGLTPGELDRTCAPPSTPGYPTEPHRTLQCLHVILNEEWEHHRYATRDLWALGATAL